MPVNNLMSKSAYEPVAGWCTGKQRPRKPAQSGYKGQDVTPYCKACFKEIFNKIYEVKQASHKRGYTRGLEA